MKATSQIYLSHLCLYAVGLFQLLNLETVENTEMNETQFFFFKKLRISENRWYISLNLI